MAAVVFDIDGTLNTADPSAVDDITSYAKSKGASMHINTARSMGYCAKPSPSTTKIVSGEDHHCLVHPNPPVSKVLNMKKIQEKTQIPFECVFLIDDRPENIEAVKLAGFSGILVDEKYGIR